MPFFWSGTRRKSLNGRAADWPLVDQKKLSNQLMVHGTLNPITIVIQPSFTIGKYYFLFMYHYFHHIVYFLCVYYAHCWLPTASHLLQYNTRSRVRACMSLCTQYRLTIKGSVLFCEDVHVWERINGAGTRRLRKN